MKIITLHITAKGKVHGVFFRKYTRLKAIELHIAGWVKNILDGSVEITAQGDEENINLFIEWCKNGPPAAKVEELIIKGISLHILNDFVILK